MGDFLGTGEAALIRAVRSLDQGDLETIPDRLERVLDALSEYPRGSFHAAAEMLLRWLLKNMTGSSVNAERVRRYPPSWDLLAAVFAFIPSSSLAKSLADRRFVGILQQTLKDIAAPQETAQTNGADSDVEMTDAPAQSPANPRRRKRSELASFNITVQRQVVGCLQTAEAVFEALRILLSRCEVKPVDGPATYRMGAEHIKSLFSLPAAEVMAILVPWLTLCGVAMDRPTAEPLKEQASWLSTFTALWELHLQTASDASEVATHLSGIGARLLGRLKGIPRRVSLGIDPAAQARWVRDLHRFLTRNLVLPARAAFLTRGSQEVVQIAVDMSSASAHTAFPLLFDLVTKSPKEFGGKTSKKDYESWVQAFFDAILHASKNIGRESSATAVRTIMEMAAERGTVLSPPSLRAVCKRYALKSNAYDWRLLLSIVKLNPDVFLLSEEGKELLEQVLEETRRSDALSPGDFEKAAQFIVLLAEGYAQGRDLSTFIKTWLKYLAPAKPKGALQPLWAQKELANTVARLIQSSLSTSQLIDVLEWLDSQGQPADSMARIHILEAISSGITQEEFIDATNMKTFHGVFSATYHKKEMPAISASRWTVASRAIARGTLEEAGQIWSQIKSDLKSILRKFPIDREDTLAAFKCCAAAWLANYPGAEHEDSAASLICAFVKRLEKEGELPEGDMSDDNPSISRETYIAWIISDAPRLLSLFLEREGYIPNWIPRLISAPEGQDASLNSAQALSRVLLQRESSINHQKLMDLLVERVIPLIDIPKAGGLGSSTKLAVQFLLDVPIETLTRSQRETAMKALVSCFPKDLNKVEGHGPDYWKPALSLMVKLMGRPTFYEDMSFSHLEAIGRCLWKAHHLSALALASGDITEDRYNFQLLQQLAGLTIRQMASGNLEEREKAYLTNAASTLRKPGKESDSVLRLLLLQAFITALQGSPAVKKLDRLGIELDSLKRDLLQIAVPAVKAGAVQGNRQLSMVVALEALGSLDHETVREALSDAVPQLLEDSDVLVKSGVPVGWDMRIFLAYHFPERLASPLRVKLPADATSSGEEHVGTAAAALGKLTLLRYVDTVGSAADEKARFRYLQDLLLEDYDDQEALGRHLVIHRLVHHLKGCRPSDSTDRFDLAQAHSTLCNRLQRTTNPSLFILTAKTINLLLDQSPACMTQWNIELTLSSIAIICSQSSTETLVSASPRVYESLCRLAEAVIKRHRKRLDGHFHILVTALQALLRLLLSRPPPSDANQLTTTSTATTGSEAAEGARHHHSLWEKHAKLFSRLLTLVCEPTVASVSRSQTSGLDSEKDRAKRYTGQFMYLVLMQYVKLQLEYVVPLGVRDALEAGIYSIMDITTQDGLKVMNDAMDPSGRVIFKDLYKQYQKFGKWTGV